MKKMFIIILTGLFVLNLNSQSKSTVSEVKDISIEIFCEPFETQCWQAYLNFDLLKRKFKNIKLNLYPYISKSENNFVSSRGDIETNEVVRIEAIIQKYPSKLNDYLVARSLNMTPDGWKESLIYAQIDPVEFEKYYKENKNILLKTSYDRASKRKISGFTITINGKNYDANKKLSQIISDINEYLPKEKRLNTYKDSLASIKGPKLLIIYNDKTENWTNENIINTFRRFFSNIEIEKKDLTGFETSGKEKIKGLPAYLIEKTEDVKEILSNAVQQNVFEDLGSYYVYYDRNSKIYLVNRKEEKNKLELFVMSQCPFGVMAENTIIDAIEKGKISKDIKVEIHYIADAFKDADGNLKFYSLHGEEEWKENIRQIIIKKYYPDKFYTYLKERNKNYSSGEWQNAAKAVGIEPNDIENKFEEGKNEFLKDIEYTNSLGINVSPTFILNGNIMFSGISQLKEFDDYKNVEIQNLNSNGGCGK